MPALSHVRTSVRLRSAVSASVAHGARWSGVHIARPAPHPDPRCSPACAARRRAAPADLAQWRFDEAGGQVVADAGPSGLDGGLGATDAADAEDPERIAGRRAARCTSTAQVRHACRARPSLAPAKLTAEAVVRAPCEPGLVALHHLARQQRLPGRRLRPLHRRRGRRARSTCSTASATSCRRPRAPPTCGTAAGIGSTGTFDGAALRLYVDGRPVGDPMPAPLLIDYETAPARADRPVRRRLQPRASAATSTSSALWGSALSAGDDRRARPPRRDAGPAPLAPLPAAAQGTVVPGPHGADAPAPTARRAAAPCAVSDPRRWRGAASVRPRARAAGSAARTEHARVVARRAAGARRSLPAGSGAGPRRPGPARPRGSGRSCIARRGPPGLRARLPARHALTAQTTRPWRMVFSVTTRGSTNCSR